MTPERLDHFRAVLEAARAKANRRINDVVADAPGPEDPGDVGDAATHTLITDTALDAGDRRSQEAAEIDEALLRLDRGEFGRCEICGREI